MEWLVVVLLVFSNANTYTGSQRTPSVPSHNLGEKAAHFAFRKENEIATTQHIYVT
jgi:hypothetical protein